MTFNNNRPFGNSSLNNPASAPNLNNGGRVQDVMQVFDTTWKANHQGKTPANNPLNNNGKPGYLNKAQRANEMSRNIEGNTEINRGVKLGGILDGFKK